MKDYKGKVISNFLVASDTYCITIVNEELSRISKPGQFCNIKVNDYNFPLLRRPFSISDASEDKISFIYNIVGKGTEILSQKKENEVLDILGPLGNSFNYEDDYEVAVLIAGGLGIAPFYFLKRELKKINKKYLAFIGARDKRSLITYNFEEGIISTDKGDSGFKGNVIESFMNRYPEIKDKRLKIFACGPNPMLREVQKLASELKIKAELSLESPMACGFGICQGCSIKAADKDGYYLVCKDGPIFEHSKIII